MTAAPRQVSPKSAHAALTGAAYKATSGVGPKERDELANAIEDVGACHLLTDHPHAETLRALFRACCDVLCLSRQNKACGRELEIMDRALKTHLQAVIGPKPSIAATGQGQPRTLTSSWPGNSRVDRTDWRQGKPQCGID
jgi:hypothetical protein